MVADTSAPLTDQREPSSDGATLNAAVIAASDWLAAKLDELIGSGVLLDVIKLRELHTFIGDVALPVAQAYERTFASTCANCGGSMGARTGWLCELCTEGAL